MLSFSGCLFGLLAIHVLIFHDHWLGRKWFPFDFPAGYYATVAYWVTSLQSWEWPQWVPYQSMGYPLLMNPQMGFFYPPFWLFVILHIPYTLHAAVIVQILHILFGAVGFLLLAHSLFRSLIAAECGAAAFLLFGGFYTNAEHADIIRGFAWVPWLLWTSLLPETQLKFRNFLLPAAVSCFVTGAYTGQVIAGLFLLAFFLAVQSVQVFVHTRVSSVFRTLVIQFGLVALGLWMAGAFLITGAALAGELSRARNISSLALQFLPANSLFDLVFPSTLIHAGWDVSMLGMQLPVVLLLFLPLIELRFVKRLIPLLTVAALASLMLFVAFARISNGVRHLLPVLGLSRFPGADYREFIYLAVLLVSTGGLASAIAGRSQAWKKTALVSFVAALFGVAAISCLQHDVDPASLKPFLHLAKQDLLVMLGATVLLYLCCRLGKPHLAGITLLPLMLALMLPLLDSERQFWADPDLLRNVYDGQARPLEVHGALRTASIFRRHEMARGPRAAGDNQHLLSWWGYLDGVYLTNDSSGAIPLTRKAAERDPAVMQFMLQSTRLLAIPCDAENNPCDLPNPAVSLENRNSAGTPLQYSRNSLTYELELPARSLVVENEAAIRGWHIAIDGTETPMKIVDGCLRGWVSGPGKHSAYLHYQTPLLIPGLLLSGAGFIVWIVVLWYVRHPSGSQIPTPDCVILVSSDRTGG